MRLTFAVASLLTAVVASSPALAQGLIRQVGADSFHVRVADLNLRTASGRATALARTESAAARLCRGYTHGRDRMTCETGTLAAAVRGPVGPSLRLAQSERAQPTWAVAASK